MLTSRRTFWFEYLFLDLFSVCEFEWVSVCVCVCECSFFRKMLSILCDDSVTSRVYVYVCVPVSRIHWTKTIANEVTMTFFTCLLWQICDSNQLKSFDSVRFGLVWLFQNNVNVNFMHTHIWTAILRCAYQPPVLIVSGCRMTYLCACVCLRVGWCLFSLLVG